ncbi:hypothetical protein GCM10028803_03950 [Larkinella knui]|uniref:Uncharacterized protein n=1 Tax=Larkinella knui TaxID=2025310 RepID=A0A3P1CL23_9BACT|nr:hypothetical protein [Larkinella knui]RRB13918.1 hypothetical protein EHT87_16830 [Larkinella knui]
MRRRNFPSILLYGFGLALALSLGFNGFLLYDQNRQRNLYGYELGYSVHPMDLMAWQQQLSDCKRANQQKDSLILRLEQIPNAPPGGTVAVQRIHSK